jgi:hypothetical protein
MPQTTHTTSATPARESIGHPGGRMTKDERTAYNRLVSRIHWAKEADARAAAKWAGVDEARAELDRIRAAQDAA